LATSVKSSKTFEKVNFFYFLRGELLWQLYNLYCMYQRVIFNGVSQFIEQIYGRAFYSI
jgi:hypothetical protein